MAALVGRLSAFLAATQDEPWAPAKMDCCMFLAAWAMWLGYPDPAGHLRNLYHDEDGFRAIIADAGGVVPVVASCIAKIDGVGLDMPAVGAVGVIGSPCSIDRQWGAIFDGRHWLVRSRLGTLPISASAIAIWKI
jgi:hypothetical protein